MTMLLFTWTLFILITFAGFCYTFGGKTMNDRSNGAAEDKAGRGRPEDDGEPMQLI